MRGSDCSVRLGDIRKLLRVYLTAFISIKLRFFYRLIEYFLIFLTHTEKYQIVISRYFPHLKAVVV